VQQKDWKGWVQLGVLLLGMGLTMLGARDTARDTVAEVRTQTQLLGVRIDQLSDAISTWRATSAGNTQLINVILTRIAVLESIAAREHPAPAYPHTENRKER